MASLFFSYLIWWRPVGYLLMFLGMMIEGDALLFMGVFLAHQGFFDIGDLLIVAGAGVLMGDMLWYYAGSRFGERMPSWFGRWVGRIAHPFDAHIVERPFHTIFISKFAYGMHHALLARAGMLKLPFQKFIRSDLAASFFWMLIVGGLGYVSSASFVFFKHYLRFAELGILAGILLLLALEYGILRRSRNIL